MKIESIKTISITIMAFVIYILFQIQSCNNYPTIKDGGTTVIHKTDTIYKFQKEEIKVPVYISKPTLVYVDTTHKGDDSLRVYDNVYEDTNITGNLHSITLGKLLIQDFTYKWKKPIQTIIYDSTIITNTIIVDSTQRPRTKLGIGVSATYDINPKIYGNILLKTKKDIILGVGYDPFNKGFLFQMNKIITLKK